MKLFRIFKEINNYFFLRKVIKKNRNSEEWLKHNLRVGYFNIIYSVINLPPEVYESEEQYFKVYVLEELRPINEYLESLNLQEIVSVYMEDKCDAKNGIFAYGIKYIPLFKDFTLWWVIKWITLITASVWTISKYSVVDKILNWF